MEEIIDLHLHTNLSDGRLSPNELVKKAIFQECRKIAITDHEVINDYSDLANSYGISIINGIEFNTSVRGMHILGYGIMDIERLRAFVDDLRFKNQVVCYKVIELLQKGGFDISVLQIKEFLDERNIDSTIIDKRKIVKYLIFKGYADTVLGAYEMLIGPKAPYYVPNIKITPMETIKIIRDCGGLSVWAHPFTVTTNYDDLLAMAHELKKGGLDGIEIFNKKANLFDSFVLFQIAERLNLIETVGSDFHDPNEDTLGVKVNEQVYEKFAKHLTLRRGNDDIIR